MSWIVPWQGKEYDVDPADFSGIELSMIKQRTGYSFKTLMSEVADLDADAMRALFWTIDRRTDPELKFGEYPGPSMATVLPHIEGFTAAMNALTEGKARTATTTTATSGSQSSPSDSDGPEPSTTN